MIHIRSAIISIKLSFRQQYCCHVIYQNVSSICNENNGVSNYHSILFRIVPDERMMKYVLTNLISIYITFYLIRYVIFWRLCNTLFLQ